MAASSGHFASVESKQSSLWSRFHVGAAVVCADAREELIH